MVRDPVLLFLAGLILLLVPAAIALVVLYDQRQEQRALDLPPLPSEAVLLDSIRTFNTDLAAPRLALLYQAHPIPRTGVQVVYGVYDQEQLVYRLALVRPDSTCSTCGDPGGRLIGVVFSPTKVRVQGLVSLTGGKLEKGTFDPAPLLAQLQGVFP